MNVIGSKWRIEDGGWFQFSLFLFFIYFVITTIFIIIIFRIQRGGGGVLYIEKKILPLYSSQEPGSSTI